MTYIKHIAGSYDDDTKLQLCSQCGSILWDNNGVYYLSGEEPPRGWSQGADVFVSEDVSGRTRTIAISEDEQSKPCF